MKSAIKIIFIFSLMVMVGCQSEKQILLENKEESLKQKPEPKKSNLTKELRLTYHAVWVAKENFELLKSGSIFGTGNSYEIRLETDGKIQWIRLSSTDRENQSQFPYFYKDEVQNPDVSYFVWGIKNAVFSCFFFLRESGMLVGRGSTTDFYSFLRPPRTVKSAPKNWQKNSTYWCNNLWNYTKPFIFGKALFFSKKD